MTQQTINIGTTPNDGTGDTIRNAFDKVNDNFDEVYSGLSFSSNNINVANTIIVGNSTVNTIANSTLVQVANSTATANLTVGSLVIGLSTVNTTTVSVGANVVVQASGLFAGNSTVNSTLNSTTLQVSNATSSVTLNGGTLLVGNSTVNSSVNSSVLTIASANVTTNTFTLGSSSGTANGYTVLPNALKLQWGNYTSANSTANVISFTAAFTTNVYSVTVTSNTAEATHMPAVTTINSTAFTVITANTTASTIYWQAIGV